MSPRHSATKAGYHHGHLRRALLGAALEAVVEAGPAAVSLRDLARRAGVSHAAPAHHFGSKAGLLTDLAAEGYAKLGDRLRDTWRQTSSFLEVGVAYVMFAVEQRGYFEVMFRTDLLLTDHPELAAARRDARALLREGLTPTATAAGEQPDLELAVTAWALVHGLATLILNNALPKELGDDTEQVTRSIARRLFSGRFDPAS